MFLATAITCLASCSKSPATTPPPPTPPTNFTLVSTSINNRSAGSENYDVPINNTLRFAFSSVINKAEVPANILIKNTAGTTVAYTLSYERSDSTIVIQPAQPLAHLSRYTVTVAAGLKSKSGGSLSNPVAFSLVTSINSSRKFAALTDDQLLTLVQQKTFQYFWDFGHPTSGLARERNTSGDLVTTGGSGFGIMGIVVGISRNFITRAEGVARVQLITSFLKNTAQKFHGAFPHWLNGNTGAVIPFSTKDDGADLVETSYLVQGLLTARQYFNGTDAAETQLRNDINTICDGVEWSWFQKNNEDVLYWHWSPTYNWDMNQQIKGWNEALVTYVLAASSPTHAIAKPVYDIGWASNGAIKTNKMFYGYNLPLGPDAGGPLFFAHYSFLGIDPTNLVDQYANYFTQNKNHSLINHAYCLTNPRGYFGYSNSVWGLTASDIPNGYTASSPTNDVGVIAPTAALSSFPYTPVESMKALRYFYYVLGDKLWKQYGFVDAFSLKEVWFADSFLAIDQGPELIMIENYRSGLLWSLFTSCPEVKTGMRTLGFTAPYL